MLIVPYLSHFSFPKNIFIFLAVKTLDQGWATLFDSRATLVTKLVDEGQYKYNKDLFDMTFEKNVLLEVHFL